MSTMDDERVGFDDDNDREDSFNDDESPYHSSNNYSGDENHFSGDEPSYKHEDRHQSNYPRQMRPMRHQGPQHYRPRQMYHSGYRGHHRGIPGGNRAPYMRPNRNGHPYDNYGPPPMGMSRHRPPRYHHQYPPRFQSNQDDSSEEQGDESQQCNDMMYSNHNDGPHSGYSNMRPRGPPPYMGSKPGPEHSGPAGVPPPGPPPGAHGAPYNGPYGGPPGPYSNAPPGPPPYSAPPGQPYNGPSGAPFNSYGGPPAGPPYNGPPFSAPPGGPPYTGQPGEPQTNAPPGAPYAMPPRPFVPPGGPPFPGPPGAAPATPGVPFTGQPTAPTASTAPGAPAAPVPTGPQMTSPPVGPHIPQTSTSAPVPGYPYSGQVPPASEASQFGLPPPGFMGLPGAPPHPMAAQPPIHPGVPGAPTFGTPGVPPMPMMAPPPMSAVPPGIPPFRPPMPFMPPTMPVTAMPPAPTQPKAADDIWVENLTAEGKPYFYNMRTRETRWDRPEGVTIVRQGEVEGTMKPSGLNAQVAPTSTAAIPTVTAAEKPPEVAAWTEYHNQEGKAYYHNTKTGETTWEKPKVLADWEKQQSEDGLKITESQVSSSAAKEDTPTGPLDSKQSSPDSIVESKVDGEKTEDKSENVDPQTSEGSEAKEQSKTPKDNSRPISSTAVPGTPWCVVWTGDGRAFFFNPSQRLSVWEKPDELKGRADVDRLLEKQPNPTNAASTDTSNADDQKLGVPASDESTSAPKRPRLEAEENSKQTSDSVTTEVDAENKDTEKTNKAPEKIPIGMEAAKEAEERAARERAVQPLEVRVRRFKEMLVEMKVSAFSTWEKELHKIVFDPRYLLLASKERRQTFEAYVKERAEEERKEKKNKIKERKEKFTELLEEAGLSTKSTFVEFSSRYAKDDRFKAIEKSRDREAMFHEYLADLSKREKEDRHREKEKIRSDFINMLKEQKGLSRHTHWNDIKRKVDSDPRYKAVDSSSRREELFKEFIRKLDEVPVREDSSSRKEREKRERQEASIREREKEVKEDLTSSMKERDKEREKQMRTEQENNFRIMLTNHIRDPNLTWKEVKKILRKDPRWEDVSETLQRVEREGIFKEHMASLLKKSRDAIQKPQNDTDGREKRHSTVDRLSEERNSNSDEYMEEVEKRRTPSKESSRR